MDKEYVAVELTKIIAPQILAELNESNKVPLLTMYCEELVTRYQLFLKYLDKDMVNC